MIGDEADPAAESLLGMLAQANMELEVAQDALDGAEDNSADETEIDRLTKAVTAAEGMRNNYKMMLDTAKADLATVTKERDDAMIELAELRRTSAAAVAAAALKERIAREKVIKTALDDTRVAADAAVPLPTTEITAQTNLIVKRSVAGMVTVDVNGATNDVYTGGETTAGSGDWNSVTMTRTGTDEAEHTLVIYTDIDAPADTKLTVVYTAADGTTSLLANALAHEGNMADRRYGKAQSDDFPSGPGVTLTYGTGGGDKTVVGTFDGVPGQFICTLPMCSVTTNAKGELNTSPSWSFTADAQNTVTVKVPDTGYAYFGWWLSKPKLNNVPHSVAVFAGGTNAETPLAVAIEGSATYSGPAAGKYVTKTFSAGPQTDAGVGHFTANAKLTAAFGDATTANGTIGGSITGFELDDGSNPSWTVKLEDADFTADGTFGGTTEVSFGGALTDTADDAPVAEQVGHWQGAFYGGGGADAVDAPDAVAGTFDAVTENASVIGGFGATKN